MDKAKRKAYETYIRGPVWKIKRQQALIFHGNKCKVCGGHSSIQMHHLTYDRFGGAERMSDLVPLCKTCHKELGAFHWKIGRRTKGHIAFAMFKKRHEAKRKKRK